MDGFPLGMPHGMQGSLPLVSNMMMPDMMRPGRSIPGQGAGMQPKRQRSDGSGNIYGAARENSVFYKTRLCHKFSEGQCQNGDRCNYAHGEAELRDLPPEGQAILDNKARSKQEQAGRPAPPLSSPTYDDASQQQGVRGTPFKSRLCNRYMQKGDCPYGPSCHFAHGYEDLQSSDLQRSSSSMPQERAGFEMPFPRPGMMRPGGPMMPPPDFMAMAAMGGLPPGAFLPRPRPPPGPPPGEPPRGGGPGSPGPDSSFHFDVIRTPSRLPSDVGYLERVKATCAILGVGAVTPKEAGSEAVEAAVAALQTGEAFQSNVYAESLESYLG